MALYLPTKIPTHPCACVGQILFLVFNASIIDIILDVCLRPPGLSEGSKPNAWAPKRGQTDISSPAINNVGTRLKNGGIAFHLSFYWVKSWFDIPLFKHLTAHLGVITHFLWLDRYLAPLRTPPPCLLPPFFFLTYQLQTAPVTLY